MNVFYSDSKTDLKLRCNYHTKFQLFEGAQEVFSRLTAVCCMLLPHNPYGLPQHYKKHDCGPSSSCKHQFLWISPIFEHKFCLKYTGTMCHWWPFRSTIFVHFIGQCLYFKAQWNARQAINKGELCLEQHYSLNELCSFYVLTYESEFLEGFWRWRGSILANREMLTVMGPAAYQTLRYFR